MKLALALAATFCLVASRTARADEGLSPEQIADARAWIAATLDGTGRAPSKAQPLDYVADTAVRSCKKLKPGRVIGAKQLAKLRTCLRDAFAEVTADEKPEADHWYRTTGESVASAFAPEHARRIKVSAKGATWVSGHFDGGDGTNLRLFLALGPDGAVRAVWFFHDFIE